MVVRRPPDSIRHRQLRSPSYQSIPTCMSAPLEGRARCARYRAQPHAPASTAARRPSGSANSDARGVPTPHQGLDRADSMSSAAPGELGRHTPCPTTATWTLSPMPIDFILRHSQLGGTARRRRNPATDSSRRQARPPRLPVVLPASSPIPASLRAAELRSDAERQAEWNHAEPPDIEATKVPRGHASPVGKRAARAMTTPLQAIPPTSSRRTPGCAAPGVNPALPPCSSSARRSARAGLIRRTAIPGHPPPAVGAAGPASVPPSPRLASSQPGAPRPKPHPWPLPPRHAALPRQYRARAPRDRWPGRPTGMAWHSSRLR
jgi:hypothetical protein